ncbi:MAG: signal peptidase I [Phycisphaeraceae bacterium]
MADPNTTAVKRSDATNESIKDTIESIIIAFVLAFVFRAYVVEAFVIPTGSMAPTLLGAHVAATCPECGYQFSIDVDEKFRTERLKGADKYVIRSFLTQRLEARCPICSSAIALPRGTPMKAGDRILVLKYIYNVSEPRRWDVVVFKNPQKPEENYIKRLVGLPREELYIVEGNIYTRPLVRGDEEPWTIARKSDRPQVQRAVWQPIYHSDYLPLDSDPAQARRPRWTNPWEPTDSPDRWPGLTYSRSYRHEGSQPGGLRYRFATAQVHPDESIVATRYAYNQFRPSEIDRFALEPIEDIRLAVRVTPDQPGLSVTLQTTGRWESMDGNQRVVIAARIAADGTAILEAQPSQGAAVELARGDVGAFLPGQSRSLELWYVDQGLTLWVDGRAALESKFTVSNEDLVKRPPLQDGSVPEVEIRVEGSAVTLYHIELDRDLYYSSRGTMSVARGGLVKGQHQGGESGQPVMLGEDQFFCMGDNSPMSHDSRYWSLVEPWIRDRVFHAGEGERDQSLIRGRVPRELMMGRAFFVYWPATYPAAGGLPVVPNFGSMRMIH